MNLKQKLWTPINIITVLAIIILILAIPLIYSQYANMPHAKYLCEKNNQTFYGYDGASIKYIRCITDGGEIRIHRIQ